jgi:chromate reductase
MTTLKTVVLLGSGRNISPPWGGPSRLGTGVLEWVKAELAKRTAKLGDVEIKHDVTVFDPLEVFGEGGALEASGAQIKTPHFFYVEAPPAMTAMLNTIAEADCFLIVTPEYNHTIPPALAGMMGHFAPGHMGGPFGYKPCGILTYSIGPFGGTRAAIALRPFLAELGTLSVSKLACFSEAQSIFNKDGSVIDESHRQLKQFGEMLNELEWYAVALAKQRKATGTP